ncbi:hypothetical protein L798_05447 [Zootermopsis nevadensis]|uniref:Uncharacterized protein n=1 Tax=Zootermopsis nevadensis TaxID=136037 RepID=A0A067RKM9_ZOONE|nr:hypothetical protein L798_05447 [Zootermopsis nevadensis]
MRKFKEASWYQGRHVTLFLSSATTYTSCRTRGLSIHHGPLPAYQRVIRGNTPHPPHLAFLLCTRDADPTAVAIIFHSGRIFGSKPRFNCKGNKISSIEWEG